MPYAVVAHASVDGSPVTGAAPHLAHAAFLDLVRRLDPALSNRLHAEAARKPFTVRLLSLKGRADANETNALRLTLLDDALFAPIVGGILQAQDVALRIGDSHIRITRIATHPDAHHLAGFATYEQISREAGPCSRIAMRFVSPTVFRSQGRDVLWPDPRLVWQSWVRAWNTHCDPELSVDEEYLLAEAIPSVLVTSQQVTSRRFRVAEGVLSGFIGAVQFDLKRLKPDDRRLLSRLAEYAFYCGTGRKTTMGLGQTRALNLR